MTDIPEEETGARKIEKRRSWKEITSSASSVADPSADDYAIELELFERDEIDKSLWAKHLVEAKGDKEEAKWLYVKERALTAPARRAEADRLEEQRRQAEEDAIKKRSEEARERAEQERFARIEEDKRLARLERQAQENGAKELSEEARKRAEQERAARVEEDKHLARLERQAQENGIKLILGLSGFLLFTAIVFSIGSQ